MRDLNLAITIRETAIELASSEEEIDRIVIKLLDVDIFAEIKNKPSLGELGILFGLKKERIRQIYNLCINKIRTYSSEINSLDEYIYEG